MEITKKTLSDQIYEVLREEIIDSKIELGSKLVNRELQRRFDVSSSPVRDAINKLYLDGLIESVDKSGARVITLDYEFFLEVNEILLVIVSAGMKFSFEKNEDKRKIYDELCLVINRQTLSKSYEEYYKLDYEFHKIFVKYSYNSRLIRLFKEYNALHQILVKNYWSFLPNFDNRQGIEVHEEIAAAFIQEDLMRAIELNGKHYKSPEKIFRKIFISGEK